MNKQIGLSIDDELIIDYFAGGGGASTGIELALRRPVDLAVNHDEQAVAMHRANHPQTKHFCKSVFDVDPEAITQGRPVGLAWFSPDCKHFSKAKGSKPRSKGIRGLAWVVINCVNKVAPRVIMLENVEEFQNWGPLNSEGVAHEHRKGWFFQCFKGALERRGYAVDHKELRACDYGAGTIRRRLFLVARRDGQPIVWPEPTHFEKPKRRQKPWVTAAACIDPTIPCPSIFLTPEEIKAQGLNVRRPLAPATERRIARGMWKFVLGERKPYLIQYYSAKKDGDDRIADLDTPLPTQTAENRFGIVTPYLTEFANGSNQRNFSSEDPLRTQCAEVKGGHFALVAPFLAKHYGGVTGTSLEQPTGTVTTIDHHSLVAAHVTKMRGDNIGHGLDESLHTISAQGTHHGVVATFLTRQFGESNAASVEEPAPTIMPGGLGKTQLVAAFLCKYYGSGNDYQSLEQPLHTVRTKDCFQLVTLQIDGSTYIVTDIGLRMFQPHELYAASGFPKSYIHDWGYFEEDGVLIRRPLNKTVQVRMVGNAVPPQFSEALARANVPELAIGQLKGAA
ncbi:MAG: DNA cytosine methyltransferase [Pseudomonadota bacterium]